MNISLDALFQEELDRQGKEKNKSMDFTTQIQNTPMQASENRSMDQMFDDQLVEDATLNPSLENQFDMYGDLEKIKAMKKDKRGERLLNWGMTEKEGLEKAERMVGTPGRIASSASRGLKKSSGGLLVRTVGKFGLPDKVETPKDAKLGQKFIEGTGEVVGDTLPFILFSLLGAKAGAVIGSTIGSLGGPATAGVAAGICATVTGTAAGMAGVTAIKSSYAQFREYKEAGGDLSMKEFLERATQVAKETGKSAVLGGVLGAMGKIVPVLEKIGLGKFLNSKTARTGIELGAELGGIVGTDSIFKGKLPNTDDFLEAIQMMGQAKLGGFTSKKASEYSKMPLIKPIESKTGKVIENIKKGIEKFPYGKKVSEKITKFQKFEQGREKFQELLNDYVGVKNVLKVRSAREWGKNLKEAETKLKRPFTSNEHLDMIFLAQETGNPFIKGDTFEKLYKRSTQEAKDFIEQKVRPATTKMLMEHNADPLTKDINPRDGLLENYLYGVYEGTPEQIQKAMSKLPASLRTTNPFANQKVFLNYNEAMVKAGLKPRFKSLPELMEYTQNVFDKMRLNVGLVDIVKKYKEATGEPIIVTDQDPTAFFEAKNKGYIPFYDKNLRTTKEGGKFKLSAEPALVTPEFADVFDQVFMKTPKSVPNMLGKLGEEGLKGYDAVNNKLKRTLVAFSLFHYNTQIENLLGQLGIEKTFNLKKTVQLGEKLIKDQAWFEEAVLGGAEFGTIESLRSPKGKTYVDNLIDFILGGGDLAEATKKYKGVLTEKGAYLHKKFIPRIKAVALDEVLKSEVARFETKYKREMNPAEAKKIRRVVSEQINNVFGGQNWETSRFFKNPKLRKWLGRLPMQYTDWTISNLKQAFGALAPGLKGKIGRRYLLNYVKNNAGKATLLRALFGGFYEDKDKKVGWSQKKSLNAVTNVESFDDLFAFQLPDVKGIGRNPDGTRMKLKTAKQLTEVKELFSFPKGTATTMFNKSAPIFQELWKQTLGRTPAKTREGSFTAESARIGGKNLPWGGKETFLETIPLRLKSIAKRVTPYALSKLIDSGFSKKGVASWIQTGFGTFSSQKEMTIGKAGYPIKVALESGNAEVLEEIKKTLKNNDYSDKQIKSAISNEKNAIKNEKYDRKAKNAMSLSGSEKEKSIRNLRKEMRSDPLEFSEKSIDSTLNRALGNLKFEGTITRAQMESEPLYSIKDDIKKDLRSGDTQLKKVRNDLRSIGKTAKEINNTIRYQRNAIVRDKYNDRIRRVLLTEKASEINKLRKEMANDILVNKKGLGTRFANERKKLVEEGKLKKKKKSSFDSLGFSSLKLPKF